MENFKAKADNRGQLVNAGFVICQSLFYNYHCVGRKVLRLCRKRSADMCNASKPDTKIESHTKPKQIFLNLHYNQSEHG